MTTENQLFSPRLRALQQELAAGNLAALDAFWQGIGRQGTPLLEPMADEDQFSLVTFLWRSAGESSNVAVVSALPGYDSIENMSYLPGTDIWYKTYKARNDTRDSYQFLVAGSHVTDPLNPRQHIFPDDEENNFTATARHTREVLQTKGYVVHYSEFMGRIKKCTGNAGRRPYMSPDRCT